MPPIALLRRLVLAAALVFALPAVARAVTVTVEPADTTVAVGATFRLRVVTSAVSDLKGCELVHAFDAGRLGLLSETPGDVFSGTGRDYAGFNVPDVAAPVDSTTLDAAMLDGSTAGPGVIAYIEFTALHSGDAAVTCAFVQFRSSVNAVTLPDCTGAVVHVSGPVPARRTSFGRLKTIYR